MKYALLSVFSMLILSFASQAQGLSKVYDSGCDCEIFTNHFDNGQVSTEYRQNMDGKRIGQEKTYFHNGQLSGTRTWVDGKLNGEGVHYHRNGALHYKEYHTNGEKTGTWVFYDPEGDTVYEITYNGPEASDATYTFFSAGVPYLVQEVSNGSMQSETVLNQEIFDAKVEEAEAAKATK